MDDSKRKEKQQKHIVYIGAFVIVFIFPLIAVLLGDHSHDANKLNSNAEGTKSDSKAPMSSGVASSAALPAVPVHIAAPPAPSANEIGKSTNPIRTTSAQEQPDNSALLNDAKALDDKYGTDATVWCASHADDYLRSVAKYDFKWDDIGFLDSKFDRFKEMQPAPGVLTMVSHKIKLQNGFGAYERMVLYCDYDTQKKQVLGYSINAP